MKVIAAYAGSFVCYWLGHAVSRMFLRFDSLAFLYPVYDWLMTRSIDCEDWAGIEYMWGKATVFESQ